MATNPPGWRRAGGDKATGSQPVDSYGHRRTIRTVQPSLWRPDPGARNCTWHVLNGPPAPLRLTRQARAIPTCAASPPTSLLPTGRRHRGPGDAGLVRCHGAAQGIRVGVQGQRQSAAGSAGATPRARGVTRLSRNTPGRLRSFPGRSPRRRRTGDRRRPDTESVRHAPDCRRRAVRDSVGAHRCEAACRPAPSHRTLHGEIQVGRSRGIPSRYCGHKVAAIIASVTL